MAQNKTAELIMLLLQRMTRLRLLLLSVFLSAALTEGVVYAMGLLLRGEVPNDYLLTGLVASLVVSSLVVALLNYFLGKLAETQAERRQAEFVQHEAQECLHKIASQVPGVLFQLRLNADGGFSFPYASEGLCEIFRVSPAAVLNDAAKAFAAVYPDDLAGLINSMQTSAQHLAPWRHEFRVGYGDGALRWLFGNAIPQQEADGQSVLWHGFITDVTERRQAITDLRIVATAFESQEAMAIIDANQHILRVNQAFVQINGYSAEEVTGQTLSVLKSERHDARFYQDMWKRVQASGTWQGEVWHRRKNGEVCPEWLIITAVTAGDEAVTYYVATLVDITHRKAVENEIKRLAFNDPLTQLPNRRLLLDRLHHAKATSARSGRHGALLFIDLDNFKILNDTLGHDQGDLLLQQVAGRLPTCVRECDTVARLGGDEFVVMLEDLSTNPQEAAAQTEVVGEKILATLNQPYHLDGQEFYSTPSIGITLFSQHKETVDELLKWADIAMYQAKSAGRNTLRFFDTEMQNAIMTRVALEAELRLALQQNDFALYYQVQVDSDGRKVGAEALIRWQHSERGLVSPAEFIPLAEENGLILPLGTWVLETACAQLAAWAKQPELSHLVLAINVSARQLRHPDFVEQVLSAIHQTGASPDRLKLELTESQLLHDVEDTIEKMMVLKEKGVGFSLDDFGTGYSSLSYLKRLPLDQLKIDRSFVHDVLTDPNDAAIARAIITMAQTLGIAVIAEGVETEAQRDFLIHNGCSVFQGYLFGRPVPAEVFGCQ